eukprot:403343520
MSSNQIQLDYEHLREKQKELQEKEQIFNEQKELQRQVKLDIDEKQKQLQLLNNEIKTKQNLVKRIQTTGPGQQQPRQTQSGATLSTNIQNLENELQNRQSQIDLLNDRLLKQLELDLDKKDSTIAELKKKNMIQEEAINEWIVTIDEKKKQIQEKDKKIQDLSGDNTDLFQKLQDALQKLETSESERTIAKESEDKLKIDIAKIWAENEKLLKFLDEIKLSQSDEVEQLKKQLEDKDIYIDDMSSQILNIRQQKQEEIEQLAQQMEIMLKQSEQEKLNNTNEKLQQKKLLDQVQADFDAYRQEREIEDLLVVKFDINSIDEQMLTDQTTQIEDLEKEKAKLESKILEISKEFNLVVTDKNTLADKIHMFQTKCKSLEEMLNRKEEDLSDQLKKLRHENQLLQDNLQTSEQTITDLKAQIESLLSQKKEELIKLKKEYELSIQKEQESKRGLEKQFKKSLQEKEILESKLKQFYEELEKVEEKMQSKNNEISKCQENIAKLQKQIEELKGIIANRKKQEQVDLQEQENKLLNKDQEIQVLKEMIKGIKLQLKQKTNEIRENVIEQSHHHQNSNQYQSQAQNKSQLKNHVNQNRNPQLNNNLSNLLNQNESKTSLLDQVEQQNQAIQEFQQQQNSQFVLPPISNPNNNSVLGNSSNTQSQGKPPQVKSTGKRNSYKSTNLRSGNGIAPTGQRLHNNNPNYMQQQYNQNNSNVQSQSNFATDLSSLQNPYGHLAQIDTTLQSLTPTKSNHDSINQSFNNNGQSLQQQQVKNASKRHKQLEQAISKNQSDKRLIKVQNNNNIESLNDQQSNHSFAVENNNIQAFNPINRKDSNKSVGAYQNKTRMKQNIIDLDSKSVSQQNNDINNQILSSGITLGNNSGLNFDQNENYQDDFIPINSMETNQQLGQLKQSTQKNQNAQEQDYENDQEYQMDEFILQQKQLMSQLENIM